MEPDSRLEKIFSDNKSGSTELVLKLNKYFKSSSVDPDKIPELIKIIRERFYGFEVAQNYLNRLQKYIRQSKDINIFLDHFENEIFTSNYRIYNNAKIELLKLNSILTLSNSKTLSEVFKFLYKDNPFIQIIIAESRPKLEGRILAKTLLKEKMNVELIADSALPQYIQNADAVIIGADKILKNGNIINKTGSLSAAISCNYYKKPLYVLASKYKFSKLKSYSTVQKDPSEIWNYTHHNLIVTNYYFEEIQNKLITKIFSD